MKTFDRLPGGYRLAFEVDMKKDKKLVLWVNIAAMAGAAVMAVPMAFIVPLRPLFDMSNGFGPYFLRFGVLIAASWLYIVLHELTHGAAYKLFSKNKLNFGFNGLFAWCGCRDCFFPETNTSSSPLPPSSCGAFCSVSSALFAEHFGRSGSGWRTSSRSQTSPAPPEISTYQPGSPVARQIPWQVTTVSA